MLEKRKAIRVKSSLFVQYCFENNGEHKTWDITTVKDIGEKGVCILTGKSFEIGSLINLSFKIPSRPFEKTEVIGKVVACSKTEQAASWLTRIEFNNLDGNSLTLFQDYIKWVIKNQSPRK